MQRNIVGIDLGTTHTVLAHAQAPQWTAEVVPTAQLTAPGEIASRPLLPSFLYAPLEGEDPADPWGDAPWVVGAHARQRGLEVPERVVSSAKSWLCHGGVDRRAPILPWGGGDGVPRLSPVEASTRLLRHLAASYRERGSHTPLSSQHVILTVPASFDQVARELTVEAAHRAGLAVRLLEEPQAALYDFLATGGTESLTRLASDTGSAWIVVCDIGGGTTDLTLFRASIDDTGGLDLERKAVGKHLLLGGDNMDLALAHAVERRLSLTERLDPTRFAQLVLACRAAKERLLASGGPDSVPIRILGRGAALVGSTLSSELTRGDIESVVLAGFLPEVDASARPSRTGAALVGFGLPYERDPAITRHLAAFIHRHLPNDDSPVALLLAGGIFNAESMRHRMRDIVGRWFESPVTVLEGTDPDRAVARGAVAYGLAIEGRGLRIKSGAARGYYLGIDAEGSRDPRAVCVLPRGAPEGERHRVGVQGLSMIVGRPVRFELYSSDEAIHEPGSVVSVKETDLDALSPVTTTVATSRQAGTTVPVALEGELTPIGTLELHCVEVERDRRHRLDFELRKEPRPTEAPPASRRATLALPDGRAAIDRVFGSGADSASPRVVKDLVRDLERLLGERASWPTDVSRELFDAVIQGIPVRKRSADHERVFWMIAGFCLRPGYGFTGDETRVAKVARLFSETVTFKDETRVWQQFFIAFRRVAGGLHEKTQLTIRNTLDPFLAPEEARKKRPKGFRPLGMDEMLEMASMLERVPAERRAELGGWLLERTWTSRDPRLWRAIGRLGARVPVYASAHHVVPPETVGRWVDHLLRERWDEMPTAPRAALWMARMTGDRARDLPESNRQAIATRLEGEHPEWARALREPVPLGDEDRADVFGEALPIGLKLTAEPTA